MAHYPRVLHVDTSFAPSGYRRTQLWDITIDYQAYAGFPRYLRKIENLLRLDLSLALWAKALSPKFDLVLAGSERVGIPLALLDLKKPLVSVVHHIASPRKKLLFYSTGAHAKWKRVGYLCDADRFVLNNELHVSLPKLFRFLAAPIEQFRPGDPVRQGPILSVGVSKRDYETLIFALRKLPDCRTEIFASTRYPVLYRENMSKPPAWVSIEPPVGLDELGARYEQALFVVIPLVVTTQYNAGATTALESAAAGKAIIATKTKGMADYVVDGVTGILVPPHDVDAMACAIRKLKDDPDLAIEMGRNGRKFVEENFDPRDMVRATQKVILEACAEAC